jgi:adenylate cyclase
MQTPARILVIDDQPMNVKLLVDALRVQGYEVATASSGREALEKIGDDAPDLVLLDVVMPEMNGYEVCRTIRARHETQILPVIMVTALDPHEERIKGLEAGADDFLTKPVNQQELMARVRSLLRIKSLHDTVQDQAHELTALNRDLERRVAEQVSELQRLSQLKRFFSPQLAARIVAGGAQDPLASHRREITVVFLDLRGFTSFAEKAEPEEVMALLREFHAAMGELILAYEGTLERFTGDGLMVFFNDPEPIPKPVEHAVRMALAMRDRAAQLGERWRKLGYDLGLAIGLAHGYATLGAIGFEARLDYAAIGSVTNLAARLCGEARPGQILVSQRVLCDVEDLVDAQPVGDVVLKGFAKPLPVAEITRPRLPAQGGAPAPA